MPIYLKLGTVVGESKAEQHEGWIELDSFSFGEARTSNHRDPDDTSGAASCARRADSTSVALRRLSASGKPQEATVDFVDRHGYIYSRVMFSNLSIVSHSFSSAVSDGPPMETFTLDYGKMWRTKFSANSDETFRDSPVY